MANTIKDTVVLVNPNKVVVYTTIAYVDAQETDKIVYDSSAIATLLGISDPLNCALLAVKAYVSAASTARAYLEFDATTDVLAMTLLPGYAVHHKFDHQGNLGLLNTAGSGKTGDIVLTTTGLSTGDTISIELIVRPS